LVDQMGDKVIDLRCAHLCRMSLVVIEDELADPAGVGSLSAEGIVEVAQSLTVPVKQFFGPGRQRNW
jgi:hypothetical protein